MSVSQAKMAYNEVHSPRAQKTVRRYDRSPLQSASPDVIVDRGRDGIFPRRREGRKVDGDIRGCLPTRYIDQHNDACSMPCKIGIRNSVFIMSVIL